jgi:tripartite-type tricarboxylate transporter receptor subunit TctC
MKRFSSAAMAAIAAAALSGAVANQAAADPVADFYKGKSILLTISTGPGGGYATYAVTTVRHLVKHLPGKPGFRRQHRQGAGGIVAARWMYSHAPKDGTVIATVHREAVSTQPLFRGMDKFGYNPAKFSWIGSADTSTTLCVAMKTAPVKKFEDLYTTPLIVGGVGPGSGTDLFPRFLNNLLGTKFKLITGYPSGSAVAIGMDRGEVQGRCAWSRSSIVARFPQFFDKINILAQFALKKNDALPNVPLIMDLAKNDEQREIMRLVLAPLQMARPLLAPPGIPKDRLNALRAAFDATMKDKAYLADMKKLRLEPTPLSGQEIEELIAKIYSQPPELIQKARDATSSMKAIQVTKKVLPDAKITSAVSAIKSGGREISFKTKKGKTHTVKVSGSRTKVTVAGKKTKRKDVKVGMTCTFVYKGNNTEAKSIDCK